MRSPAFLAAATAALTTLAVGIPGGPAAREGTASAAYEEVAVGNGGSIAGVVRLPIPPVKEPDIRITKDESVCGTRIADESVVRDADGGLKSAVVHLEQIARGKSIDKGAVVRVDTYQCRFEPHVLAMAVGQKLQIVNGDPILHNPHARLSGVQDVFNIALPVQNLKVTRVIREPGDLRVTCDDGHIWMLAWIHAFPHPYFAVTDAKGAFRIEEVPAGAYRLRAWHEALGTQVVEVSVSPGEETRVAFEKLSRK